MWLTCENSRAMRTGIWADGYIWAERYATADRNSGHYFWRGRSPPTATTLRRALLRDLRQRAALGRRQADMHVFLCKADYHGHELDSDRLYEYLGEHGDPDFYRQLVLTIPYAESRTRARQIKISLDRLGFRSAHHYRDYDALRTECLGLLRDVTKLYETAPLSMTVEYLSSRKLTVEHGGWVWQV